MYRLSERELEAVMTTLTSTTWELVSLCGRMVGGNVEGFRLVLSKAAVEHKSRRLKLAPIRYPQVAALTNIQGRCY